LSIIYDALQKTQKNQPTENPKPKYPAKHFFRIKALLSISLSLLVIFVVTYAYLTKRPQHTVTTLQSPTKLSLNGVFVSNAAQVAMINHRMFHVGDQINNMKVISIEYDGVKLANGEDVVILR